MAAFMLHRPPTNLVLLAAKEETYQNACLLTKNIEDFFFSFGGKQVRRMGQQTGKRQDRKSNGSRQRNKRGASKVDQMTALRCYTGGDGVSGTGGEGGISDIPELAAFGGKKQRVS